MEFNVELSSYGSKSDRYDVEIINDSKRSNLLNKTILPCKQKISMLPLSIVVIEIKTST